jgi:putative oxidoreductase
MIKSLVFGGAVIESALANVGLTILRVFTGLSMAFAHGLGKIPPSERFVEGTANMGFPMPEFFAWAAGLSEFGGGVCLALGLFTRPSAFFLCCTMFVAGFIRHAADPFGGKEKALLFLAISLAFLLIGAGKYGVDAWVRSRR